MNKKELVVKYHGLVSLACRTYNLQNLFRVKKTGNNNRIIAPCALLKKVNIRIKGSNNTIIIGDFTQVIGASIYINGNDNRITIGNAKKRQIEMLMRNYAIDVKNGNRWNVSDVQVFAGQISYLRMVEPDVFERILRHINGKFSIDIMSEIKADLK